MRCRQTVSDQSSGAAGRRPAAGGDARNPRVTAEHVPGDNLVDRGFRPATTAVAVVADITGQRS